MRCGFRSVLEREWRSSASPLMLCVVERYTVVSARPQGGGRTVRVKLLEPRRVAEKHHAVWERALALLQG